jgi:hypothetical protein
MDSITSAVSKVIDSLYQDVTEGLIRDYVVIKNPEDDSINIHILMNMKSYWEDNENGRGGFYNVMEMKKRIKAILKYISVNDVNFHLYLDDDGVDVKRFYNKNWKK